MAFESIALDGFGVLAYCDGINDSSGGVHAELGGGGITYELTNPYVGAGSIGHEYASKSGFGYYTHPTALDFSVGGTEEDQLIYPIIQIASSSAFDTLANNGFSLVIGTDTSNYRTYKLVGSDANNGWGSGWRAFAIDPRVAGSIADVGTFDLANIKMVGLWMDTIVSVRAPTIFYDYITVAKGIKVTGTGTLRELIDYCTDTSVRAFPILQEREDIAFCYGKITAGDNVNATVDTIFTDDGEVVKFSKTEFYHDTNGWSLTHPSTLNQVTVEKHASFDTSYSTENTNLLGDSLAKISMSNDSGAILTASGGQFKFLAPTVMNSDQDISNAVLTDCSTRNINGGTFNNNTINTSDSVTTASIISGNTFNSAIATAVITNTLNNLDKNTFNSSGTLHGVDLGTISTDVSMNWDNFESGYTDASSGNETILVSVDSGITLTINVASGASTPSVYNTGLGTVSVEAGLLPISFTVKSKSTGLGIPDANVMMQRKDTKATIVVGTTDTNGLYSESIAASYNDVEYVGWVRQMDLIDIDYVGQDIQGTIKTTGADVNVSLEIQD